MSAAWGCPSPEAAGAAGARAAPQRTVLRGRLWGEPEASQVSGGRGRATPRPGATGGRAGKRGRRGAGQLPLGPDAGLPASPRGCVRLGRCSRPCRGADGRESLR